MRHASSSLLLTVVSMSVAMLGPGVAPAAATVINEFPVPTAAGQPNNVARGPDGNLWFVEAAGNKIGRITPAGVITEFPIPTPASSPFGITEGPDGALWFTEQAGNKVGRITVDGAITEFPIPTPASAPQLITLGPDGNLWFTELDGNKIGRITPGGVITEFPVPTAGSEPARLISADDLDGNLWFVETKGNKIGRITPAGVITEFAIPTAASDPQQIATGPDGNLWFVEQAGNKIGRITPAGVITEFPLPGASRKPNRILAGRDENLWFTESGANRIGRITPAGAIDEFLLPSPSSGPNRIARGRDANLWFGESTGNRIGRITYAGIITEFPVATAATGVVQLITGFDGNLWYIGGTGNVVAQIVDDAFNAPTLAAAVLPGSRSVQVGQAPATLFATIINAGGVEAQNCEISGRLINAPGVFLYQRTDPATNALAGTANTPVNIPAGGFQTYFMAFTPSGPFAPEDFQLSFICDGIGSARNVSGVNTAFLSASSGPVPDIVALVATAGNNGIVDIPGDTGAGAFAAATVNVGAGGQITATVDTGSAVLPLSLSLCQTVPATGLCMSAPTTEVTVPIGAGETPTFAVFVQGTGPLGPFDAAVNRVNLRFKDAGGVTRGSTSVAARAI